MKPLKLDNILSVNEPEIFFMTKVWSHHLGATKVWPIGLSCKLMKLSSQRV